ncbi:MAG TPA: hypothetical protein VK964_02445 [Nocardioidaceae bacterium]|nr:hypothetical protein [Nocardioidaceae bacterium]
MRVTADGRLWTMQEPFGSFRWYAVNGHPSDKAGYDVRVDVPGKWVGVSNGRLASRRTSKRGRSVWSVALRWERLRRRLVDETLDRLVRRWPKARLHTSSSRADLVAWWSAQAPEDRRPGLVAKGKILVTW